MVYWVRTPFYSSDRLSPKPHKIGFSGSLSTGGYYLSRQFTTNNKSPLNQRHTKLIHPRYYLNNKALTASYLGSTSNHNSRYPWQQVSAVVSYLDSTSNHNMKVVVISPGTLYLIWILHQTTTFWLHMQWHLQLYLIWILHQTTTVCTCAGALSRLYLIWILHQTTTGDRILAERASCILFEFYIKPQLCGFAPLSRRRCILFEFYIKPQL